MKRTFSIIIGLVFCITFISKAQNQTAAAERIGLTAYIPESVEGIPEVAVTSLQNKLSQIITAGGFYGGMNQRFIVTAKVNVLTKDITPTTPAMHAFTFDVTLYIGDGVSGTLFASTSTTIKGVGETETKAYLNAFSNLRTDSPDYQKFIETGKNKIIAYYNANCEFILKDADLLASTNNFQAAISHLLQIPNACEACYTKALSAIKATYQKYINHDCSIKLQQANAIWNAAQDYDAALKAAAILTTVEPDAACFKDVKLLFNKIENSIKQRDEREWNYILKEQVLESERITAIRAIGVAYGTNQPNTVYNVKGWW